MYFTRTGLEQATRAVVADRRAARLAAAGARTLADLGCGLGSDALAAARAGITVYAVDADPLTAALAAANAAAAGLADRITVECADATGVPVERFDAVFADPARRRAGGRRVFDPKAYSPPWNFVAGLAGAGAADRAEAGSRHRPRAAAAGRRGGVGQRRRRPGRGGLLVRPVGPRAAPGHPAAGRRPARARPAPGPRPAPVGPGRRAYLYDPDPAVVRAHLVAELAAEIGGRLADPDIAYIYADEPVDTPFARRLTITDVLPFSLKRLRALLRERGVGRLEIRKRGSALEPDRLRRDLRLPARTRRPWCSPGSPAPPRS